MSNIRSTGQVGAVEDAGAELRPDACVRVALARRVRRARSRLRDHRDPRVQARHRSRRQADEPAGSDAHVGASAVRQVPAHAASRSVSAGYSLWRLFRAAIGHGPEGSDKGFDRLAALGSGLAYGAMCVLAVEILLGRRLLEQRIAQEVGGGCPRLAGRRLDRRHRRGRPDRRSRSTRATGASRRSSSTTRRSRRCRPRVKTWIGRLGTVGHLARMVVFGLVGIFLIKAAVDFNPRKAVGLDGALAKIVHRRLRPVPARHRRRGLDRVRALLAQRRPLPQDLTCPDGSIGSADALSGRVLGGRPGLRADLPPPPDGDSSGSAGRARSSPEPAGGPRGEFPPRSGNSVEILIDGAQALPSMVDALRSAQSHVHLTGWYFSPDVRARARQGDPLVLRNLLAELAERLDVRVLAWAGAPLPLFRPSRARRLDDARPADRAHEDPMRARCEGAADALPPREDDRRSTTASRSSAGSTSPRSRATASTRTTIRPASDVGWHDACARIEGPAVGDVAEHFRMRWHEVTGETARRPPLRRSLRATSSSRSCAPCPSASTTRCRAASSPSSSRTCARSKPPSASSTSRTSSSGRPRSKACCSEKIVDPPAPRLPALAAAAVEAEQRRRRHARRARPPDRRRRRRRTCARLHALRARRRSRRPHLHPRKDRDRRRRLAHDRLRQSQRALAVQRHRDEHRQPTTRNSPGDPPASLGGASRTARASRSRAIRSRRSTSCGSRSARSSSNAATAGRPLTHRLVRLPNVSRRSARALGPSRGLLVDG